MTPLNTLHFAPDIALPATRQLRAGRITIDYERGNLRSIRFGSTEVLRMIYIAVRDQNWATADCSISDETVNADKESFDLSYKATWSYGASKVFEATVRIGGEPDGSVHFEMQGSILRDFRRNRIGICVHHPIRECAGKEATIKKPDGSSYKAEFPELIAPHQPFLDIQNMCWHPAEDLKATLTFSGDIFETEDQRNWGDACYKTYSTPLNIPFPVDLKKGHRIAQSVSLQVKAGTPTLQKQPQLRANPIVSFPFPSIGLQRTSRVTPLKEKEAALLQKIHFGFYRSELHLEKNSWHEELKICAREAAMLNAKLDLIVFFHNQSGEIAPLVESLLPHRPLLHSLLVLKQGAQVTPSSLLKAVYPLFKKAIPELKIGYGTDAYFTELNRNRPDASTPFDFVSFSVNPQVHASDTRSIMENVETLPWVIKTARSFAREKEVFVSPLTLKKRNNPDASSQEENRPAASLPEGVDSRQASGFLAVFTLLAIAGLAAADLVVLYETVGWKGVMQGETEPDLPDLFPAKAHQQFPVYELLEKIREFAPVKISRNTLHSWNGEVKLENNKGELLGLKI